MSSIEMNFQALPGPSFLKLAIGSPEIIWGITEGHTLVRYAPDQGNESPWETMPALDANHKATALDCAEDGTVLIIGTQVNTTKSKVFRYIASVNDYQEIEALVNSSNISVGSASQIYAAQAGKLVRYWGENETEAWSKFNSPLDLTVENCAAAADGTVLATRFGIGDLYAYPKQLMPAVLSSNLSSSKTSRPAITAASAASIFFVDKSNHLSKYLCEHNTTAVQINKRVHAPDKKGDFVYSLAPLKGQILDINACNSQRMVMVVKEGASNTAYLSLPDTAPYASTVNQELNVHTKTA